jgi:adenine nucleotide transporter 17
MALVDGVAGGLAGLCTTSIFYPLNLVNTRLQAEFTDTQKTDEQRAEVSATRMMLTILREKGPTGLYVGAAPFLVKDITATALQYFWKSAVRKLYLRHISPSPSLFTEVLIGMVGCGVTNMFIVPWDNVVVHQQTRDVSFRGAVQEVCQDYGIYKGLLPSQILTSNPAITFAIFDKLKLVFEKLSLGPGLASFCAALLAKIIALLLTFPLIRCKVVLQSARKTSDNEAVVSVMDSASVPDGLRGLLFVFQQILQVEGLTGFYKGIFSQLFSSVMCAILMLTAKDKFVALLQKNIRN